MKRVWKMGSEWTTEKVGSISRRNTEAYSPKEKWDFVNYLDTGNIKEGKIDKAQRISDLELLPSRARRKVQQRDIVYSTVRPNQRHYGIIAEPLENMLVSTGFAVLRGVEGKCNTKFLYYFLTQQRIVDQLQTIAEHSTTAYPSIRPSDIELLDIELPPLSEQRAIAHILGSLDDKIELNRKMNETLEAMVRAIFKSWFVDFDPVLAKAEGRDPGLPKEIADLFPDSFDDSELGPIPKGWEIKPLHDLFDLIGGGTPKTSVSEYWGGTIPWFSVVDAPSVIDVFVIDTEKHITELGIEKSSTKILPLGTTIISARGTVGKCAVVGVPMAMNQSCYGIRGKKGIADGFVYYTIREQVADLQRSGHGSVFNTITRETFKSILVPFASPQLTQAFDKRISPFFAKIRSNLFESKILSSLRDTLLPKLISGDLRVRDAEKFIEEAGV